MKILIRGAGDLATGIAVRLYKSGHEIIMTERAVPLTVRRSVAFSRAVYEQEAEVEGIRAVRAEGIEEVTKALAERKISVIVDECARIRKEYHPDVIVDAILAKRNTGTNMTDAPFVIGAGPGFTAGKDCHCVVETKRGHDLGRVIWQGSAAPNTGIPGEVGGFGTERLIKAAAEGVMKPEASIGDYVQKGQIVAYTGGEPVRAGMSGMVRGMLQPGVFVSRGLKIGDIDARTEPEYCVTVSDKARAVGGGVLEAVSAFYHREVLLVSEKNSVSKKKRGRYMIAALAAGTASRYGKNKLLDLIKGKRMFEYVFHELNEIKQMETVVVTGYDEIENIALSLGFDVVRNEQPLRGISYSVKLGLLKCLEKDPELSGVIFTVCDQPWLQKETFLRLLELSEKHPGKIICTSSEGRQGNPVLWDRKYFRELLLIEGDTGGRQVIKEHEKDLILLETKEAELQDIDTPLC